ncbi:MAG TPA: hypothetical protein VLD65_05575 [Anaerolineales bacterium]|nr:hypothetical protein [Anaerolineales bacterium]
MSIGAILVGIAIILFTIPIVIKPFLNNKLIESSIPADTGLDNPGDRHSELLMALRDLDSIIRLAK